MCVVCNKGKCETMHFLFIVTKSPDCFFLTGRALWNKKTKYAYKSSSSQVNLKLKQLINNEVIEF